ncbi:MAG TPA: FecR domain-containing protein [Chitinophaga sp.]|uniref:FecR family protein n=1 Tax=Chitinophaga sp. TaxID=1869181 RepID=UPI002CFEE59B|nr:FecR domain-containing protein [Chitinophaga sp.]HVI48527.1 FecR domain-containing protein [Chitinophaga sp.]
MNNYLDLLQKIAAGTGTQEDKATLDKWLKTLSVQEYHDVLLQLEAVIAAQKDAAPYDSGLLEKINRQIAKEEQANIIPVHRRPWFRYAAAAAVLIAIALTWFITGTSDHSKPVLAAVKQPGAPGGSKAVLILAGGQQIILDSAQNGVLGNQGGLQLIKPDSGQLIYKGAATGEVVYNTLETPRGGQFRIVLPDGTHVWLNAASSLRFPTSFSGEDRAVVLTGEAYFDVTPDATRPFTVKTDRMDVVVLGTSFNVMAYADEQTVRTTLVSGAVNVVARKAVSRLTPGQQAERTGDSPSLHVSQANIEAATAWKEGHFMFDETDIQTIMRQVARWYDVEIEYQGDFRGVTLSGVMSRKENVSQLLDILETTGSVQFKLDNSRIIVIPKR